MSKTVSVKKPTKEKTAKSKGDNVHFSLLTDFDIDLFKSGKHFKLFEKLGSHIINVDGTDGTLFSVWAPNAKEVSLIGNFNFWDRNKHPMFSRWDGSGIWELFVPGIKKGEIYKYSITTQDKDILEKADPFAFYCEEPPKTGSVVWSLDFKWKDDRWINKRKKDTGKPKPYTVYEVHLGSWRRRAKEDNRYLSYLELGEELVAYVKEMGFTHVEILPVMEHPFYGSWGYQLTGYFAPTSRYGTPQEFKTLIEAFHKSGIGVILDWVPSHFPGDDFGLAKFDGTHLFEHADPRKGFHPDWKSYIYNFGRNEVKSFLISNAVFWLDKYHIDGFRVDAVASMLYLDYSREKGEWIPNEFGGNENIEAIGFLRELNETVYNEFPDIVTIAEESTSWPMVSRPTYMGGLGFGQKWMMGWMHDCLEFFKKSPIHRKFHQNEITFSLMYAFTENFMLPLSHDEVVHGKGSLIGRMPGDEWQRFANLRLLYGFMYTHPGTKLLFMGGEIGQTAEWHHEKSLDWHLLQYDLHKGIQNWIKALNSLYKNYPALYDYAFQQKGFEWIDYSDTENSVILFNRIGFNSKKNLIVVCNFTPETRYNYRIGVPYKGYWEEVINSDLKEFGGSDVKNTGLLRATPVKYQGKDYSLNLTLPPLGIIALTLNKEVKEFEMEVS
ncbi:MAG: 1,4-alpha-glucan branching protein GlgB [Bacteroidetes bacterium]|nr:1,4-alpha-glucan branching protein GlgB [Bacteroidota bacterium]